MPINEFAIWVALGTLAVGLDKVTTYPVYGSLLILIGVVGAGYGIREHFRTAKSDWSRTLAGLLIVLTWSAVAYDIYDRHFRDTTSAPAFLAVTVVSIIVIVVSLVLFLRLEDANEGRSTRLASAEPNVHEEIRFDYFPASPLENGWRIAYVDGRIGKDGPAAISDYLKTRRWTMAPDPPTEGSAMIDIDAFAMDHYVNPNAALSQRIEFEANCIDNSAMFFVRVLLATRDDKQTTNKLIKFVLGRKRKKPYRTPSYEDLEYTIELDPPSLGKGWRKFILSLPDETERSWGQDGWYYKELQMIRLRGKFGISPIRLY